METETLKEELNTSLKFFPESLYKRVKMIEEGEFSTLENVEEEGIHTWWVATGAPEKFSHAIDSTLKGTFTISSLRGVTFGSHLFVVGSGDAFSPFQIFFTSLQEHSILIPDQKNVLEYVKEYPDLIPVVKIACEKAREEFACPDQLSLEMFFDPESDDQYPTLYVRQTAYDKNILDRIDAVSEKFESLLTKTKGWFLFTTDFENLK